MIIKFFAFYVLVALSILLSSCGKKIVSTEPEEEEVINFYFDMPTAPGKIANDEHLFITRFVEGIATSEDVAAGAITSSGSPAVVGDIILKEDPEGAVGLLAKQREEIKSVELRITTITAQAHSFGFIIEPGSGVYSQCVESRQNGLNIPQDLDQDLVKVDCTNWKIFNIKAKTEESLGFEVEDGILDIKPIRNNNSSDDYAKLETENGVLILNSYFVDENSTLSATKSFIGLEPPTEKGESSYLVTGYALTRDIDPILDADAIKKVYSSKTFEKNFEDIIITKKKKFLVARNSKEFVIVNDDGSLVNKEFVKRKDITCSNNSDFSPFESPGKSPTLSWEGVAVNAGSLVMFMMDETSVQHSLKKDNSAVNLLYVKNSVPSEVPEVGQKSGVEFNTSHNRTTSPEGFFEFNCDFEYCRHWALFNIGKSVDFIKKEDSLEGLGNDIPISGTNMLVNNGKVYVGRNLYNNIYKKNKIYTNTTNDFYSTLGTITTNSTYTNETVVDRTNSGKLTATSGATNLTALINLNSGATNTYSINGYFGPCAPVGSGVRTYRIILLSMKKSFSAVFEANKEYISRLSYQNFLYYFSNSSRDERKRPGCIAKKNHKEPDNCPVTKDEFGKPIPDRNNGLSNYDNNTHYIQNKTSMYFYDVSDNCELCRFCLIGHQPIENDTATDRIAPDLDMWEHYGYGK